MPRVVLCQDGIEVALESENGLWVVLQEPDGGSLGRFAIDPSELQATIAGKVSFHATDGSGSSVSIDGADGTLKVRLEGRGFSPKNCRLDAEYVSKAIESLNPDV